MKTKVKASLGVQVRSVDKDSRIVRFTASDETVDRYGTVITVKGWELANYRKNPVFLFGHDYRSPWSVMGRALTVKKNTDEGQLEMDVMFMPADMNPVAEMVFKMYANNPPFLNSVSVGFLPIKWEEVKDEDQDGLKQTGPKRKAWLRYTQQELLELSAVTVPANPAANKKDVLRALVGDHRNFDPIALMTAETALEDEDEYAALTENVSKWTEKNGLTVPCEEDCCSKILCVEDFAKQNGLKCFSFPGVEVPVTKKIEVSDTPDQDVEDMVKLVKTMKNLEILQKAGAVLNRKNKRFLEQAQINIQNVLDSAEAQKEEGVTKETDPNEIRMKQLEEKLDQTLELLRDIYEHLIKGRDIEEEEDPDIDEADEEEDVAPEEEKSMQMLDELLQKVAPPKAEEKIDNVADERLSLALAKLTGKKTAAGS